jgi:tRNA modification GTPase
VKSLDRSDTIFALSSGKLPSGIGVIRLSGGCTRFVLETIVGVVPDPRVLRLVDFRDLDGLLIDKGLCAYFRAPASFTGEDCAELHIHGSHAVVRKLVEVLSAFDGVRMAEAGEFTRRAFLNGKLDLAEAEGLSDLLVAETEGQRRLAISQSDGSLSSVYRNWRERLVYCRSMVEAFIDFSDEDDVELSSVDGLLSEIAGIRLEIVKWLDRSENSEIVRDGFKVVIIGAPNAGKSSLLNVLAGREAAITSDEPGTTRDLVDVRLDLGGSLVVITDTAGVRTGAGKVETLGIERAIGRAEQADLVLLLEDVSAPVPLDVAFPEAKLFRVGSKTDLASSSTASYDFMISTKSNVGINALLGAITEMAQASTAFDSVLTVQQRQKQLLSECVLSLSECKGLVLKPDLLAEQLRIATGCIGRLTGDVDVEELLGVIFSRFCIGK